MLVSPFAVITFPFLTSNANDYPQPLHRPPTPTPCTPPGLRDLYMFSSHLWTWT